MILTPGRYQPVVNLKDTVCKDTDTYDEEERLLIPCYDDFYNTAVAIIPFQSDRELRILDLGPGSGILSEKLARRYSRAQFTLIDGSASRLGKAEIRLSPKYSDRISYRYKNVAESPLKGTFDLVVSALCIHNLSDKEKRSLYTKIFKQLEPGGIFIHCDKVLGENAFAERLYRRLWLASVQVTGIEEHRLQQVLERMQDEQKSPLSRQLQWLEKIGFSDITTWYQYYNFVVFSGTKIV